MTSPQHHHARGLGRVVRLATGGAVVALAVLLLVTVPDRGAAITPYDDPVPPGAQP